MAEVLKNSTLGCSVNEQVSAYFNGKTFRFASLDDPPWVVFRRSQNGSIVEYKGICYEIINTLRDFYHFSYEVFTPYDGAYGVETNGSWNGMIGMILNNESDMGIGPFSITYDRRKVVDFTEIYTEDPRIILIPIPMEDSRLLAFTKPFQSLVWLGICIMMILVPLIIDRNRKRPDDQQLQHRPSSNFTQIIEKFQSVFAVLVSQPVPALSYYYNCTIKATLIMTVWCLSSMVLTNAYTGIMMSFISVPRVHPLVKSLDELPNSNLNWVVRRGTFLENLFLGAESGIFRTIGNGLRQHPEWRVDKHIDGVAAVTTGQSVYIEGKGFLEYLMEQDYLESSQCRLSTTKEEFYKSKFAFIAAKGSPLASIFNRKLMMMSESGLIQHWKHMYWPDTKKCKHAQQRIQMRTSSEPKKLSLKDLQGSFFIWSTGFILALVAFLIELIIARKRH